MKHLLLALPIAFAIVLSGCNVRGFTNRGALISADHAAKAATPPNNLSVQTGSEIEMKMLALMPNATIQLGDGNDYDVFSYQENNYGYRFGIIHGLTIAAMQPNGPSFSVSNTTSTHLQENAPVTWSNNGPVNLSTIAGFTMPKFFYPVRHFSTAFSGKYQSVLASLIGNPTPISNIGFRSMTTDLCKASNLRPSPMFDPAKAWLTGNASSDPIFMHIFAMATQAWLTPHTANSGEVAVLRTGYDNLYNQSITDGLNASDASDAAYMGVCQAILLSPQFWVGPTGKGQALIRATIRLAGRLPTQAEMTNYLNSGASFQGIISQLMTEDGFKSTVEGWHVNQLGIQMAQGGSFGGNAFRSVNWGHGTYLRAVIRSPYVDPTSPASGKAVWIGSPIQNADYELTAENPLHMSYWMDYLKNNPYGVETNAAPRTALANYLDTTLNDGSGKKHIVSQAFDNRTSGLWFRRFNTITHQMELVGGYILDLGNSTDNGNELMLQSGFAFSAGEVGTRCSSWAPHPTRWLICKGSITVNGSGTKQDTDLTHMPLNISAVGTNPIGTQDNSRTGDQDHAEEFTTNANGGSWPNSGLGSEYANLPLYGQHIAERWSPSGKQDGFSKVYLPQSNDAAWVSNTFARFDVSCVRRNTVHGNPAPDPLTAAPAQDPWFTFAGCRAEQPSASVTFGDAFGNPGGCSGGYYRINYGYGDSTWGQHMDPITLESFHCGAVNTALMSTTPAVPSTIADAIGVHAWTDDQFDSLVPYGPLGINDRTTTAPDPSGFMPIAWSLATSSAHTYNFPDLTTGSPWTSMESAMNSSPYLQYGFAQEKIIEGESMMEPIRLLEAILDKRDGLGDYRGLITSPITYGTNFYAQYLASSGNTLPFYAPGYTPKYGLDRFAVTKIDRTAFKPIDMQAFGGGGLVGGRQSVYFPIPPRTGILTMASFTRPVATNGGKMRTMAARILSRILPAPDAFVPKNPDLHKQFFLNSGGGADPHLQPACISCHINLDPMVRTLYPTWDGMTGTALSSLNLTTSEVGGAGANINTGHQGTGVVLDQQVTGWEQAAQVIANHQLFALNAVTVAYNALYHPVGVPSAEHSEMINQVTEHFMSNGYDYRAMLLDLMTYQGYFEAIP